MFIEYMYQLNNKFNNIHEITEIYCSNCGDISIDNINNRCANCYDSDLYFVCMNCTEIIKLEDFYDLCPNLIIEKIKRIQRFYRKRIFIKKLIKYNNSLLKLYFNPQSIYIKYYVDNFENKFKYKQLAYINYNGNLKLLQIIK